MREGVKNINKKTLNLSLENLMRVTEKTLDKFLENLMRATKRNKQNKHSWISFFIC